MKHHLPPSRDLPSLHALIALMAETAQARSEAVAAILSGKPVPPEVPAVLAQALADLEEAVDRDGLAELEVADYQTVRLNLGEETGQVENDHIYLEQGREPLLKHLGRRHHGFREAVNRGLRLVTGKPVSLLLCDADGALRAAGQRCITAIQPAWNAVFLSRFALARAKRCLIWSRDRLVGPGLLERITMPPHVAALAGSRGREYRDTDGRQGAFPLPGKKAALLAAINERLSQLLAESSWRVFAFVGSGLQFGRGETRVARQDMLESVDPDISLDLLEHIHDVVDAVDPERQHFRVEDDGHDVAIVPTARREDVWKEFTPAEGLHFVDEALGLDLAHGAHLVCCGGHAGLALLEAVTNMAETCRCLFVTQREECAERALHLCPETVVVPHPDALAAILSAAAP